MSMMDWSGVDFTGLANLNIGDLRDSQGGSMDQVMVQPMAQLMVLHLLLPQQMKPEEKATRLANEREDAQAKQNDSIGAKTHDHP
jgi:hypothetical protein